MTNPGIVKARRIVDRIATSRVVWTSAVVPPLDDLQAWTARDIWTLIETSAVEKNLVDFEDKLSVVLQPEALRRAMTGLRMLVAGRDAFAQVCLQPFEDNGLWLGL